MKFSELTLDSRLQQAIQKLGYDDCTPIQEQAMPHVLEGRDVAGLAQTGTGKTAAFLLPLMERILRSIPSDQEITPEEREKTHQRVYKDWQARNFILVLVPTRELADQVYDNLVVLSEFCGIQGVSIYGGTGYDKQREFVIATPGRLLDLYKEHDVDLKQVRAVVFDEADRMFDMGFKDDMVYILHRIPRERQLLVFSATLNFEVLNTAYQFGSEPTEINISRDQAKAENVKDILYHVGNNDKPQHLISAIKSHNPQQSIIFTNYKTNVERIARFLNDNGIQAMAISSLLSQQQRTRVMQEFKAQNNMNVLVATDVAARGLDVQGVDLVVNYELPNDPESYVHRIGRTGRAGASGNAISLVSDKDVDSLMRIEEYLKHKVEVGYLEDSALIKEYKPMTSDEFHFRSTEGGSGGRDRNSRQGGRNDKPRDSRSAGKGATSRPPASRPSRPGQPSVGATGAGPVTTTGQGPQKRNGANQNPNSKKRFEPKNAGDQKSRPRPTPSKGSRSGGPTPSRPRPNQSLGAKVKGFFKRLLG